MFDVNLPAFDNEGEHVTFVIHISRLEQTVHPRGPNITPQRCWIWRFPLMNDRTLYQMDPMLFRPDLEISELN